MDAVRVGVVGLGFGEHHVRTLVNLPGARLAAVADNAKERLERIAGQYGVKGYTDGVQMMEREKLDALCVCVSPKYREPLLSLAVERGIALFVEKPWAADLAQAKRLADICSGARAPVMVGFSFRFHPAVRRLLELMRGELGRGWLLNAEYVFDWLPPRESWLWDPANGNGIFNENSCHIFDVVCAVMGRPETVSAAGAVFVGRPSEEAGALALKFEGGGIGAITVGGVGASPFRGFPRLDVCTEKGRAELRGSEHTWRSLEWGLRGAKETSLYVAPPESLGATRYTAAMEHFFAALRSGTEPEATVDDGVLAVALAEAVYRAARTRETVRVEGTGRP